MKNGIKSGKSTDFEELLLSYFSLDKYIIPARKRNMSFSSKFIESYNKLEDKSSVDYIIQQSLLGKDLNKFQSKRLTQLRFHDHLVNEWSIYHFHVSKEMMKNSAFVKQVNKLLFAYIQDSNIIFLDLVSHKKGQFGDKYWIEILHREFPDVIKDFRDKGNIIECTHIEALERQMLWDKGYSVPLIEIDKVFYISPGLGRTAGGFSIYAIKKMDLLISWIGTICDYIISRKLPDLNMNNIENRISVVFENRILSVHCTEMKLEVSFPNNPS